MDGILRGMTLNPTQLSSFYSAWWPLLRYVNERKRIVPANEVQPMNPPFPMNQALMIRNALWEDDALRHAFVAENPAGLPMDALALIESWDHRRGGSFTLWKHYKKHSVFLGDDEAYAVLGLTDPLPEMLPREPPLFVDTVLLPFGDVIVYDGLLMARDVLLGSGIRRDLQATYRDLVERGRVRTSLRPETPAAVAARQRASREAINGRVLADFRKSLFLAGRSQKIAARDIATIEHFAERLGDRSLRECTLEDVVAFVTTGMEERLALRRFLRFLRETGRSRTSLVEQVLDVLRTDR